MSNMSSSPTSPPPDTFSSCTKYFVFFHSANGVKITIDVYFCFTSLLLTIAFFILATRFRLWHKSPLLEQANALADNPATWTLSQALGLVAAASITNDLYSIWLLLICVQLDSVITISADNLWISRTGRVTIEYARILLVVLIGVVGIEYHKSFIFWKALIPLWALLLLKSFLRIWSYRAAAERYGVNNIKLITDYMRHEHVSGARDGGEDNPVTMKGYKYIVLGEELVKPTTKVPEYSVDVPLTEDVITVDRVWESEAALLTSDDQDGKNKDICLSFALFKLIRRRFFSFRSAESGLRKTRALVFRGLLAGDDEDRVFRVINMELGFLRDFFYTKYPIVFAHRFPVYSFILAIAMFGVNLWIAVLTFYDDKNYEALGHLSVMLLSGEVDIDLTASPSSTVLSFPIPQQSPIRLL